MAGPFHVFFFEGNLVFHFDCPDEDGRLKLGTREKSTGWLRFLGLIVSVSL